MVDHRNKILALQLEQNLPRETLGGNRLTALVFCAFLTLLLGGAGGLIYWLLP